MNFEKSRALASMVLACTLALTPSGARAAAPGDATAPEPTTPAPSSDEPAADTSSPPAPSEAAKQDKPVIPPPRLVTPPNVDAAPAPELRTCFVRGRDVCRTRTILGGVSLGLGIASAATGVALTLVKSKVVADDPSFERAYLPAGLVLTAASVPLITMGGMLIADAVQRKRGAKARFAWRAR